MSNVVLVVYSILIFCVIERTDTHGDEEMDTDLETIEQRYNLANYDDEDDDDLENDEPGGREDLLALTDLTVHASNAEDPYLESDGEDSADERENMEIKATDNLLLIGHVSGDAPLLEVHVHNKEDFYPHHELVLPAYPLSLQCLRLPDLPNCVATADFTPEICIWNLDVLNLLEPVKKLTGIHKDSVLTLSWDEQDKLASGGADHRLVLWDLISGKSISQWKRFTEKVQSVSFHPNEKESLLIGDCSGHVTLADIRSPDHQRQWSLSANPEIECVMWDRQRENNFFVSTDSGIVYCMDRRSDAALYSISAHSDAVTGIAQSLNRNCLVTVSADKSLKVWNISSAEKASFVVEHPKTKVGRILSLAAHPDDPFVFAIGGDASSDNYRVMDISLLKAVRESFAI